MDISSYHENLLAAVNSLADVEGTFMSTAFTQHCGELLTNSGEFDDIITLDFEGTGQYRRNLKVNGYELENADNSITLLVTDFDGQGKLRNVSSAETKSALKALQNFLTEATDGSFLVDREESSPAYQLAYDLHNRGKNVSRYRLYFLTDAKLSTRLRELESESLNGVPVDFVLWDIDRFHQLHLSNSGREALEIDLRHWNPDGLPALKTELSKAFYTYLATVPGNMLAGLYGKYGSRLLESNVRSYLTNRGKVNKGIRQTITSDPHSFLAFNNGITATATAVKTNDSGDRILEIVDLQIVNGGQTTASIFFVDRESRDKNVLENVYVPMKLVVVDPEIASEMVPSISRFANSQNAVSAADFFSNSPFHVRMEELSRRVLAPAAAGSTVNAKWYYERTRGQYENEKNKLSVAEGRRFEKLFPKSNKFDKPALAKHVMSWEQRPHIVSAGAQKNFIAFADLVQKAWDRDESVFNEIYFKEAVAKGILFNAIHSAIRNSDWYGRAYLANIVTYTIAKMSSLIESQGRGRQMDFDAIWRNQSVGKETIEVALNIGESIQTALTSEHRLTTNITEWAKKADFWKLIESMPLYLSQSFLDTLIDPSVISQARSAARATQRIDNGIMQQKRVLEIPQDRWLDLRDFALDNRVASPSDLNILDLVTGRKAGIPTERQSARLLTLIAAANAKGFKTFVP